MTTAQFDPVLTPAPVARTAPFALTLPVVTRWAARFEARFAEKPLAGR